MKERRMKTAGGLIDLGFGITFLALAGLAAAGAPGAFERYAREPEDLLGVFVLVPLLAAFGVVALLTGTILLRGRSFTWIAADSVAMAALATAFLLLLLSVIGVVADEPSSAEFRFFLLPALALGWSYVLIRTRIEKNRERTAR
jgi:ABC-type multidrug transport system permease subunit